MTGSGKPARMSRSRVRVSPGESVPGRASRPLPAPIPRRQGRGCAETSGDAAAELLARVLPLLAPLESLPEAVGKLRQLTDALTAELWSPERGLFLARDERTGRLRSELHYAMIDDILARGLQAYLDEFLERINAIGDRISRDFLLPLAA